MTQERLRAHCRGRVKAGAKWLDELYPDWRNRIDIGKLDMGHSCLCVLGQLGGSYREVMLKRSLDERACADMGFTFHMDDIHHCVPPGVFLILKQLWIEDIQRGGETRAYDDATGSD